MQTLVADLEDREHLEHDDAELQKIHQAAADGRLRKGKRSHGLLDDDSSEDEEKARGKKFKKRKVIGTDHLDDIGKLYRCFRFYMLIRICEARNPETSAFYKTYMRDLPGADEADPEDNEFAHLNVEADDVEADADYESDNGDEEMESGSEAGEGGKKTITTNEILRIVQEKEERGEDLVDDEELMDAEEYVRHHMPSSDALMPGEYDNIKIISPRKRPGTKIVRKDVDVVSRPTSCTVTRLHFALSYSLLALKVPPWTKHMRSAWRSGPSRTRRPGKLRHEESHLRRSQVTPRRHRHARRVTNRLYQRPRVCKRVHPFAQRQNQVCRPN